MTSRTLFAAALTGALLATGLTPAAAADDEPTLSSLLNPALLDSFSSGVSSGKSVRLSIAEAAAQQRLDGLACEDFTSESEFVERLLDGKPTYDDANALASALISLGLFDREIDRARLDQSDRSVFTVFLRHVFLEKAVSCGFIADPQGKARDTRAQRESTSGSSSGSSEMSSGLSS